MYGAPASLVIAKIIYPETEEPVTRYCKLKVEKNASDVIEAAATGAGDGLHLALNVAGMLCLHWVIALVNYLFTSFGDLVGINNYLKATFGALFQCN